MNYYWIPEALVSDHRLLFYHAVDYKSSFSCKGLFRISEVVTYKSFDCTLYYCNNIAIVTNGFIIVDSPGSEV